MIPKETTAKTEKITNKQQTKTTTITTAIRRIQRNLGLSLFESIPIISLTTPIQATSSRATTLHASSLGRARWAWSRPCSLKRMISLRWEHERNQKEKQNAHMLFYFLCSERTRSTSSTGKLFLKIPPFFSLVSILFPFFFSFSCAAWWRLAASKLELSHHA